jgi:hypothetical protein
MSGGIRTSLDGGGCRGAGAAGDAAAELAGERLGRAGRGAYRQGDAAVGKGDTAGQQGDSAVPPRPPLF